MLNLTSSHWGAYRASADGNRVTKVVPFEKDPNPSPILRGVGEAFDHPTRIRRPAVRLGWLQNGPGSTPMRGTEPFVEVSWERALALVAGELDRVRTTSGNKSIFGGSYGWASAGRFHHAKTQLKRFLNGFGGFFDQVNNYSYGAGMVLLPHILGDNALLQGPLTDWRAIVDNTRIFVAFGGLPGKNSQVESGGCGEHIHNRWVSRLGEKGARVINVSPIRNDVQDDVSPEWWAIRPGTDTALILALCHTVLHEGLCASEFVEQYTVGFNDFANYLRNGRNGEPPPSAEWAAGITGLKADQIRALAREMSANRTFIALSWSMQRADFGEQPYWAAIALAAMLGQIGLPGGGVGFGYASTNGIGNPVKKFKAPALPAGKNSVRPQLPVARITDLLLKPGEILHYNGEKILLPHAKLVYWSGGNPFHHHQDINRLVQGWQKPETIVVHESWWTATARRADIVLPATTTMERNDLGASSNDRFLIAMKKIADPFAETRNDHDIFVSLADRLGFVDAFTEGLNEMKWLERLYDMTRSSAAGYGLEMPVFNKFWDDGFFEYPESTEAFDSLADFRNDPIANPLDTPSGRIEIGSSTIAGFGYKDCVGHPVWFEPREWLGSPDAKEFPLHLISNQPRTRLHGQLDPVGESRDSKIQGREPLTLNPSDAASRGLKAGDVVRVFNNRGACLAGVIISENVRPGIVQLATGAWYDPIDPSTPGSLDSHGNPNVLTHDFGTSSLSQGPAAQSALVEVELFTGPLPKITVHEPPVFVQEP